MENKIFNIMMHIFCMLLLIVGTMLFYLFYLEPLTDSLYIIGAIGIGLGLLILCMIFMLIADITVSYTLSRVLRIFSFLFSISSIVLVAVFFHLNIDKFENGIEYWLIALCGFCPVILGNYRSINVMACKSNSGILAGLSPVFAIILAVAFCTGTYFLSTWILTMNDLGTQGACILHFWMSIGASVVVNLAFNIVVFVVSLVVKSI